MPNQHLRMSRICVCVCIVLKTTFYSKNTPFPDVVAKKDLRVSVKPSLELADFQVTKTKKKNTRIDPKWPWISWLFPLTKWQNIPSSPPRHCAISLISKELMSQLTRHGPTQEIQIHHQLRPGKTANRFHETAGYS